MIPRLSEDAFIALLRRVYRNGRQHYGNNHLHHLRALSSLRAVTSPPRISTTTLPSSSSHTGIEKGNLVAVVITTTNNHYTTKRHASTTTTARTKRPAARRPPPLPYQSQTQNQSKRPQKHVAVLGGGVTGLTTAHYLARYGGPDIHVTLYEASDRLGGWIEAVRVPAGATPGDGANASEVLLQHGPRMLRSGARSHRYDDLILYDVIASLGLQTSMRHPIGPSDSRYIFYPDHLVKLPSASDLQTLPGLISTAWSLLREPLYAGLPGSLLAFYRTQGISELRSTIKAARRAKQTVPDQVRAKQAPEYQPALPSSSTGAGDESAGAFLTRVLGGDERPVRNIVGAMLHGIYGGDAWKLSAKHTILERLWYEAAAPRPRTETWMPRKDWFLLYELMDGGARGRGERETNANAAAVIEMAERAAGPDGWKLLAFEDGLVTLVRGLVGDLERRPNVTIKRGEPVTSLTYRGDRILVTTSKTGQQPAQYDHVVSTLFSKQLAQLARPKDQLPSLAETHAVTMMVVNLWYPGRDLLAGKHGFGYLIPSSTPNNDEGALGVLFDSDLDPTHPAANPNLNPDSDPTHRQQQSSPPPPVGTKLTVMLGGHHWDGWQHYPTEEMGIEMAKAVVQKHLDIDPDPSVNPVQTRAKLCRDCLPQHFVGHRGRMASAHRELLDTFKGRLSVAGPSYTTVGVVPAMRAGWEAAFKVARPGWADLWLCPPRVGRNVHKAWAYWWGERLVPTRDHIPKMVMMRDPKPGEREKGLAEEAEEEAKQASLDLQRHTGLEEFAEPEANTVIAVRKDELYFRSWTKPQRRLAPDGFSLEQQVAEACLGVPNEDNLDLSDKKGVRRRFCTISPPGPTYPIF